MRDTICNFGVNAKVTTNHHLLCAVAKKIFNPLKGMSMNMVFIDIPFSIVMGFFD